MSRVVLFAGSVGWGVVAAYSLIWLVGPAIDKAAHPPLGAVLAFWVLIGVLIAAARSSHSRDGRLIAAGILLGFDGVLAWSAPSGVEYCDSNLFSLGACGGVSTGTWIFVLFVGFAVGAWLLVVPEVDRRAWVKRARMRRGSGPTSDWDRASKVADALGFGIAISSIRTLESSTAERYVEIRGLITWGLRAEKVAVVGSTEAQAWRELSEILLMHRNANENNVRGWAPGS